MVSRCLLRVAAVVAALALPTVAKVTTISNLEPKYDTEGNIVNAHDGTLRKIGDWFYYHGAEYGLCREPPKLGCDREPTHCGFHGDHNVSIYRSRDLTARSWEFVGRAAKCAELPDCQTLYRPHLVFNPNTQNYTLFVNYVRTSGGYGGNAVYTSASPDGPFELRNPNMNLARLCPGPAAQEPCGEAQGGAGDFDVFVDDDGAGYIAYSANFYMSIEQLTPDFLQTTGQNASAGGKFGGTVFPDYFVEAASMFKRNDLYYMLYGHCCCFCYQGSGIMVYTARHPMGPWTPQIDGAGDTAVDLSCRSATDPLHVEGYSKIGLGACRDSAMVEPSHFVSNGQLSADQCAAYCTSTSQCTGFSHCTDKCPGSCSLYVTSEFPHPDNSSNWVFSDGAGSAADISEVTDETWWGCYVRTSRPNLPEWLSLGAGVQSSGEPTPDQGCLYQGAGLISTTRAQQNFVMEVPLVGGQVAFIWTGDRWQQSPDGIKGHEGQFWAPLSFDASGKVEPVDWIDTFDLDIDIAATGLSSQFASVV